MKAMQRSIPEDDWVAAEGEAILDGTPGLRADVERLVAKNAAGTLKTVDTATVRAAIEASIDRARQER